MQLIRCILLTVMMLLLTVSAHASCEWIWHEYTESQNGYWEYVCTADYNTVIYSEPDWSLYQNGDIVWQTAYLDSDDNPVRTAWYVYHNDDPNRVNAPEGLPQGPFGVNNGTLISVSCFPYLYVSRLVGYPDGSAITRTKQFCDNTLELLSCERTIEFCNGSCQAASHPEVLTCP